MKKIRVLVVDDSATMRGLIIATCHQSPTLRLLAKPKIRYRHVDAIKRLDPDVLTLDIEMPHMNGLDFLEKIMRLRPMRSLLSRR